MSTHSGPNIIKNGLVLSLDAANSKSFRGEPTTNLLLNPKPTSTSQYTAVGGTGSVTYDSSTSSVVWQRSTYETWGSFFHNNAIFNGTLDTAKQYTASFEWKETGTISHSSTWFEIVEYADRNPAVKVNMLANSTYLYDGFYRFSYTFTPANTGITANFRVWNPATSGTMNFYWRNLQLEQKGYRTPFVDGTRGTTVATGGGWADLSGNANHIELGSSVTFVSSVGKGVLNFPPDANGYGRNTSMNLSSSNFTVISFVRKNSVGNTGRTITAYNNNWLLGHHDSTYGDYYAEGWVNDVGSPQSDTVWRMFTGTGNISSDIYQLYINQSLIVQNSNGSQGPNGWNLNNQYNQYSDCQIANLFCYNRVLSESEIKYTFNALRGRYGI